MKRINNYNTFINEGIKQFLKPKSKEDILKSIESMDSYDKFYNIFKYNLVDFFDEKDIDDMIEDLAPSIELDLACEFNLVWLAERSLSEGYDPSNLSNAAIHYATICNSIDIIKFLLKDERVDPSDNQNTCIKTAYGGKNKEIIKLLLKDERVITKLKDNEPEKLEKYLNFIKD